MYDAHAHTVVTRTDAPWGCLASGDPADERILVQNARRYGLDLARGVHPWWAHRVDTEAVLRSLEQHPPDAIGEFGLDALRGDREAQLHSARLQLDFARRRGLPVVLHCVRAHGALLKLLPPKTRGLVHGWSGSAELAAAFVARGLHISFGKALLRSRKIARAAREIPATALLVESDGLLGAVEPVVRRLAELRGWSSERTAHILNANAHVLFGGAR